MPTKTHEIGDANQSAKTARIYGHFKHSAWVLDVETPPTSPEDDGFTALRALLEQLPDIGGALAELRPRYRTVIRWSGTVSGQGNFAMEAELIAALAALGCDLYGTAYPEDDEDVETDDDDTVR